MRFTVYSGKGSETSARSRAGTLVKGPKSLAGSRREEERHSVL
jgi:hypothetical protein